MKMDAAYFIAKFEAIPEEKWCTGTYRDGRARCALGHCGLKEGFEESIEAQALMRIIDPFGTTHHLQGYVSDINDGGSVSYPQPTPKQRILAALRDAQKAGR